MCFWKSLHLILMHFAHIFQCFEEFMQKLGYFFQNCVFSGISIDWGYFSINRNWLTIFEWAFVCFDRSNLRFRSIENRVGCFFINSFLDGSNTFSKSFLPFLSPYDSVKENLHFFLLFSICLSARFSSLQADKSILPFLLHFISCFHA